MINGRFKAKLIIMLLLLLLLLTPIYLIYRFFFSMGSLPKGELLYKVDSPTNEYTINIYIVRGKNVTVSDSIRGELVFNNRIKFSKNIYWQYRQSWVDVIWLDNYIVNINGVILDVRRDVYDFRKKSKKKHRAIALCFFFMLSYNLQISECLIYKDIYN